jgi:hypothetical protein
VRAKEMSAETILVNKLTDWFASPFKLVDALNNLWRGSIPVPSTDVEATAKTAKLENPVISTADPVVAGDGSPVGSNILSAGGETNIEARTSDDQSEANSEPGISLVRDDESRRKLVRALFNDFWTDAIDKPATFAERLDAAAGYINGQLEERCVGWRLDALTRKQLGLPMSASSRLVTEVDTKAPKRGRPRRAAGGRN